MNIFNNSTPDRVNNSFNESSELQSNFTLTKVSMNYNIVMKNKLNSIDINVRRVMESANYEGKFTLEDLKETADIFFLYRKLEDVYKVLVQKINEKNVEFEEDEEGFNLKFTFCLDCEKIQAVLKLNKVKEENLSKLVEDLCKTFLSNSETIKELKEIITAQDKKLEKFQEIITNQSKKIEILEKNMKKEEEKSIKSQENVISIQDNSLDDLKNSNIVKNEEIEVIKKWIDSSNYNKVCFKLLYRATQHGKAAKDFHSRCDKKVGKNNLYFMTY
jgi:hypothetical protein